MTFPMCWPSTMAENGQCLDHFQAKFMLLAILTFISLKYRIVMKNAYIFLRTMLIGHRVLHRVSGTGGSEIVPPGGKIPRGDGPYRGGSIGGQG